MGFLDKAKSWFSGKPEPDAQDLAFRNVDPFTDEQLVQAVNEGQMEYWAPDLIKTPEEYENENWDAGREMG